jgi:uncharacterized phage protein (TIGR02218 family)
VTVMRKFIPPPLAEHYRSPAVTVTHIMRIRTKTGHVYGFTDLDVNIRYDPSIYDPGNTGDDWGMVDHMALNGGFALSRLDLAANLSVDNAEMAILPGDASITPQQLMSGFLESADVRIYRINYTDTSMGHECIAVGKLGNSRISENQGFLEFLSLTSQLKQPEAELQTIQCRHIFGGPGCPKPYTWFDFEVTAVDGDQPHRIFATDISPADDFFVPGVLEWVTGDNAGLDMDVEQNTAGTFALMLPMGYQVRIGDTGRVRQDCTKLWDDANKGCLYHWGADRYRYFGGFPDIPVADAGSGALPGAIRSGR